MTDKHHQQHKFYFEVLFSRPVVSTAVLHLSLSCNLMHYGLLYVKGHFIARRPVKTPPV